MTNREIAESFAARFDPPLKVVQTMNIDRILVRDGWMCAYHDSTRNIGVTFVVFDSGMYKAYLEAVGIGDPSNAADNILAGLNHA